MSARPRIVGLTASTASLSDQAREWGSCSVLTLCSNLYSNSTALPTGAHFAFPMGNGTNFSDRQISAGFFGAGLTTTQMNSLYVALKTYLSAPTVGAWT